MNVDRKALDRYEALAGQLRDVLGDLGEYSQAPFDNLVTASYHGITRAEALAAELRALAEDIDRNARVLRTRLRAAADLQRARLRFTHEGIAVTMNSVETARPTTGRRRWLAEVAAAIAADEPDAVARLLRRPVTVDREQVAAMAALRDLAGAPGPEIGYRMVQLLSEIFEGDLARSKRVRRHFTVAMVKAEVSQGKVERATQTMATACAVSVDPILLAEQAFFLLTWDPDGAGQAAQRAVEQGPDLAWPLLAQASVAESLGQHGDAAELYRAGVARVDVEQLDNPRRGSLFLPSGAFHLHRASRLEEMGLLRAASEAYAAAMSAGVAGPELYPDGRAFEGMARLGPVLGDDPVSIREAAYQAGRRYVWMGDYLRAERLLRTASGSPDHPLVAFYLAQAVASAAWQQDGAVPLEGPLREAEEIWVSGLRGENPEPVDAWIYGVGARIAEWLTLVDSNKTSWTWRALLRSEKALVLDPMYAEAWGLSSNYLRRLHLSALALDCARRAAQLDPDNEGARQELIALLANAGEFGEALTLLEQARGANSDPWLIGVRGWLRLHIGRPAESLVDVTRALEGAFDIGWNLEVRSSILVALGRLPEAMEDLRRITIEDDDRFGPVSSLRRARAFALLGDVDQAENELTRVETSDPLLAAPETFATKVIVAASSGDEAGAEASSVRLEEATLNPRELEDVTRSCRNAVTCFEYRSSSSTATAILKRALERLAGIQPRRQPSAAELDEALIRYPATVPEAHACLVAIRARRLIAEGDLGGAADAYNAITKGPFEPQATSALIECLRKGLNQFMNAGMLREAVDAHERLASIGQSPYASTEFVIAETNRLAGEPEQAREALQRAAASVTDTAGEFLACLRLGEVEVLAGDQTAGLTALYEALLKAESASNHYGAARAHALIGALVASRGDDAATYAHLSGALEQLQLAGVINRSTTLAIELREAIVAMRLDEVPSVLARAYEDVTHENAIEILKVGRGAGPLGRRNAPA